MDIRTQTKHLEAINRLYRLGRGDQSVLEHGKYTRIQIIEAGIQAAMTFGFWKMRMEAMHNAYDLGRYG